MELQDGTVIEACGAAVAADAKKSRKLARSTNRGLRISEKNFPEPKAATGGKKTEEKKPEKKVPTLAEKNTVAKAKLQKLLQDKRKRDSEKNVKDIVSAAQKMSSSRQ